MAQSYNPLGGDQTAPPQDPVATTITPPPANEGIDDSEEWEYEYSTTETDTYYLTLDLTVPDLPKKRQPKPGAQARWLNPGLGRHKRHGLGAAPTYKPREAGKKLDKETPTQVGVEEEAEGENEEVESSNVHGMAGGDTTPNHQLVGKEMAQGIQILDLHTDNPLVSYEGRIFSCTWAENIGTELLFTKHDDQNPLPSIRTLPGNIDLLAASSARLVSKPLKVEHKSKRAEAELKTQHARPSDFAINVGVRAGPKRRDQARFLEKLIEIKEAKGEEDLVTVFSEKRKTSEMWRKQLHQQREEERKELIKTLGAGDEQQKEEARKRLAEMDHEDEGLKAQEVQNTGGKRKRGASKRQVTASAIAENSNNRPVKRQGRKKKSGLGLYEEQSGKPTSGSPAQKANEISASVPQERDLGEDDEEVTEGMGNATEPAHEKEVYKEAIGDDVESDDAGTGAVGLND